MNFRRDNRCIVSKNLERIKLPRTLKYLKYYSNLRGIGNLKSFETHTRIHTHTHTLEVL